MPLYLFKCEECEKEVEIECKIDERENQSCPECSAPPEKMKRLINTHFTPNFSWSTWRSGVNNE